MDEILTNWSTSLATHQKTFANLAQQVSAWDRSLGENAGKITGLYTRCFQAERDMAEVERQLSIVEHGQVELEQVLERYERWVDEQVEQSEIGMGGELGGVDGDRERTYVVPTDLPTSITQHANISVDHSYKTAEACSARLTEMSHNLSSMIDEINAASSKLASTNNDSNATGAVSGGDPLAQIVRVLNGHLQQLQSIDSGAAELSERVERAKREVRSVGAGSHGVGRGGQWLEGFGRSYLGRS
jgi:nuclear pore complex protein Nup62